MRKVDMFDGAKPRFLNRGKSAAQYQPLPTGRQAEVTPTPRD